MCTAVFDNKHGHFFGRTLDIECSYGEEVVITHKGNTLHTLHEGDISAKFSYIGMAHKAKCGNGDIVPLYYDGMNESGLCAAALNFPKYAVYNDMRAAKRNIASFELIPIILSTCRNTEDVKELLCNASITNDAFSASLPPSPLHWMIADRNSAIVLEQTAEGLMIYDDPVGVMTNPPTLPYHLTHLASFASLSPYQPENTLCPEIELVQYSRGMGAMGLPGDLSSTSRFVRAVYAKNHTLLPCLDGKSEKECEMAEVNRFFHIIGSVFQPLGCVMTDEGKPVCSIYTSCLDMDRLKYHYFTYDNMEIKTLGLF